MKIKKFLPLIAIVLFILLARVSGIDKYADFELLKENRRLLIALTAEYRLAAPLAFILFYMTATALSIPGGVFISILGGFLFPQPFSTIYVVIGATMGASIIFLAAKSAIGEVLKKRAAPFLRKMRAGFQHNAVSYMLLLRFVPAFPFWLVNLAPAFFGVDLLTFFWTTLVGIIPGAFVFTQAGVGLGAIIDSGAEISLENILNTQVKIALAALGLFAIVPIIIRYFWRKI